MSAHQLPKAVAAALQGHKHTQADVNGANGMAWVLSANVLHLWKYQDGPRATVHTHGLPYALPGQCHVAVVQHQVSPPVTASMNAAAQGPASWRQACPCTSLQYHECSTYCPSYLCWSKVLQQHHCGMKGHCLQDAGHVSVVLCSRTGNLVVWPDFAQNDDVATHRISETVTALAATAFPGKAEGKLP